jgi:hypothetical protein
VSILPRVLQQSRDRQGAVRAGSHRTLEIKGESATTNRKSVEFGHLFAANLTARDERQIIDSDKDRSVFPVQGTGSFVGFTSFYMQPDKTPPNLHGMYKVKLPALTAGAGCEHRGGHSIIRSA